MSIINKKRGTVYLKYVVLGSTLTFILYYAAFNNIFLFFLYETIWHYFGFQKIMYLLYNRAWSLKKLAGKVHPSLPKPVFFTVNRSVSSFLHTFIHRTLSACCSVFLVLFPQCHATIHRQSAFVPNNKSPLHSFCLQDNQMSVSYSGVCLLPPRYIVLTRSLSLPPSAPCYL